AELGGSEYQKLATGKISGRPPRINLEKEAALQKLVLEAIRKGLVQSAHDLSEGGLGVAAAESCFGFNVGATLTLQSDLRPDVVLFSESQSRILLSVSPADVEAVLTMARERQVPAAEVGHTGGGNLVVKLNGGEVINAPLS
ncbi:AIR synthase-related protein, partial [Microbacteriaceae bacterium K1510]|nr:AIR synthase-related protein [Microbacteriaceae bacterium K1510]